MNRRQWTALAVVLLALAAWFSLDISAARLGEAPGALRRLIVASFPPETSPPFLGEVFAALFETIKIAFLSTILGAALSLPLALLAANNLAAGPIVAATRTFAAAIRVFPSLLWAMIAVLVVGLGPLAGILAMTLYTVGYLSKLQYEALEGIPRDALDAVRAMGATRFQQAWHVALPEAGNAVRAQLVFMFEYNVRASSIVGLVGAGGIGQLLAIHFRFYNYAHVATILIVLFLTVACIDLASLLLRRRFIELADAPRPKWRTAIAGPD